MDNRVNYKARLQGDKVFIDLDSDKFSTNFMATYYKPDSGSTPVMEEHNEQALLFFLSDCGILNKNIIKTFFFLQEEAQKLFESGLAEQDGEIVIKD